METKPIIRVGSAEIRRVEETRMSLPIAAIAPDAAFVTENEAWLSPAFLDPVERSFDFVFQSWLVSFEAINLVVDPCTGNGKTRQVMPFFNQLETPYIERFEASGIRPEDVDFVFCTHLHCDHCGWNTRLRDGRWTPTFPNARYIFVQREFDRWDPRRSGHNAIGYNIGVFEDSVLPIMEAGLADLVADTYILRHGLSVEPAYGHTAGHSILRLNSDGDEVYFTGDAFHHPLQVLHPDLALGGCDDGAAAAATRRDLLHRLAEGGAVMLPAHFPSPHGGRVKRTRQGYAFEALA